MKYPHILERISRDSENFHLHMEIVQACNEYMSSYIDDRFLEILKKDNPSSKTPALKRKLEKSLSQIPYLKNADPHEFSLALRNDSINKNKMRRAS